jgi:CheY-like chemotaxis protein
LSNAVKFSSEGDTVVVEATRVPRAEVAQLSGGWKGRAFPLADSEFTDFLRISVTDAGIGISPDGLERLFRPFSQIDSGLARKFEGTGLGLAMVKLLAELHGGAIAAESAVGEGSRFTVWLPMRPRPTVAITPPKPTPVLPLQAVPGPGARTALVVEDDYKSADLIRVQLEAEGFHVLHAPSAEAAFELAAKQPLALITLDIMLPHMDGWEFLSAIKKIPALCRIPVVIISIVADANKGFALGAAAAMQKPISRQELSDALADLGLLPAAGGPAPKVLVVDDDPKMVELFAARMPELAEGMLRAYGGREAIEIAQRELPDLIVLDLMMPEVTGFDVVDSLRQRPETARIPILVVTAKQMTETERMRLNGYVTAIIEKTQYSSDQFAIEVHRAMSGRLVVA